MSVTPGVLPDRLTWQYSKQGHCFDCDDDDARLYIAHRGGILVDGRVHGGTLVVLFKPVCANCRRAYSAIESCPNDKQPLRRTKTRFECPKCFYHQPYYAPFKP